MLDLQKDLEFQTKVVLLKEVEKKSLVSLLQNKMRLEEEHGLSFPSQEALQLFESQP